MDLDLIYEIEMAHRDRERKEEKYNVVDYYDTYDESANQRNINRLNAKYYDSYETKFID